MAIRKSAADYRRRCNRLRLLVSGALFGATVASGGVAAVALSALPGQGAAAVGSDQGTEAVVVRERVDATTGDALLHRELSGDEPQWEFDVETRAGLVTVQVNLSDIAARARLVVDGEPVVVRNGEAVAAVASTGDVTVLVELIGADEPVPFRLRVDAPS